MLGLRHRRRGPWPGRTAWRQLLRVWRGWVESWEIADVVMPSIPRGLRTRMLILVVAALAVVFTHILYFRLASGGSASLVPWRDSMEGVALVFALLGGAASCRQQIVLRPTVLLVPIASGALALAGAAILFRVVGLPAGLAWRWTLLLAMVLMVTVELSLRLWGMLLFTLAGIRMQRRSREAAQQTSLNGDRLVVRFRELDGSGDMVVSVDTSGGETTAHIDRALIPASLRKGVAPGAWLLVVSPVVDWCDGEVRITSGSVCYLGGDPARRAPSWLGGETLLGVAALLSYHAVAILFARLIAML